MKKQLLYKDFTATYSWSEDDKIFHGKLNDTDDSITFEGKTFEELEEAFEEAVDDYLELLWYKYN